MTLNFFAARRPGPTPAPIGAPTTTQWPSQAPAAAPAAADSAQLWRLFATDAQENGDPARALQCWREVSHREPEAQDAMFHVACCHALLNEPGRACLIFDVLVHAPGTPAPLRQRCARLMALLEPALH